MSDESIKSLDSTDPIEDIELPITEDDRLNYKRLDLFLAEKTQFSRTFLKKLFEAGNITSEIKLSLNKMPASATIISIDVPAPISLEAVPQNIPLDILFEDEHLVIVNKQAGLVVHPAPGNLDGTLVNAILYHCPDLSGVGGVIRPGIVHRLDKGTSGIMVVAKSQAAHEGLVLLFSKHNIDREYEAIILCDHAKISSSGKLESTIGRDPKNRQKMAANVRGKKATTYYNVISFKKDFAHVKCKLETGRTHQIRVHMSGLLQCPILNDPTYGDQARHRKRLPPHLAELIKPYEHPFLHAKKLGFIHPVTKQELNFEVPPPDIFQQVLAGLE